MLLFRSTGIRFTGKGKENYFTDGFQGNVLCKLEYVTLPRETLIVVVVVVREKAVAGQRNMTVVKRVHCETGPWVQLYCYCFSF